MSENQSENDITQVTIEQAPINKVCTKCKQSNKTFSINNRKQFNINCDDCNHKNNLKRREYYARNKEKISEKKKEKRKEFREKMKDNLEYQQQYFKQCIKQQEYIEKNKEQIDDYQKEYRSRPINRIKHHLYMRATNLEGVKAADIKSHLGCDLNEYITYLQSKFKKDMTLENYNTVWYIKYISNDYWARVDTIEEKMAILHFTNTEPTYSSKYSQNSNEEIIIEIIIEIVDYDISNIEGRYVIRVVEGNIKKPGQRFVISNPDKIIIKIIDIFNIEGHYVIRCIKGNIKQGQRFVLSYY